MPTWNGRGRGRGTADPRQSRDQRRGLWLAAWTSKWPEYFPDCGAYGADIGLASPTGVVFGAAQANSPAMASRIFILRWAYGRIIAVHLQPQGASYTRPRAICHRRPLNVTDAAIGPDGAMYFVTGGRHTQAGLYRVSYTGPKIEDPPKARRIGRGQRGRRSARPALSSGDISRSSAPGAVEEIWPHLGSADPWIRYAARIALEGGRAAVAGPGVAERDVTASLTAALALARSDVHASQLACSPDSMRWPFAELTTSCRSRLRDYQLAFIRLGAPDAALAGTASRAARCPFIPRALWQANHALRTARLSPVTVRHREDHGAARPASAPRTCSITCFLRPSRTDGPSEQRARLFHRVDRAEENGGCAQYQSIAALDPFGGHEPAHPHRARGPGSVLDAPAKNDRIPKFRAQVFVKVWTAADLLPSWINLHGRSFTAGRLAFATAQCAACHSA